MTSHDHGDEYLEVTDGLDTMLAKLMRHNEMLMGMNVAMMDFNGQLMEANTALRAALAFAASCIKAGEPWTPECERIIDGALKGRTE